MIQRRTFITASAAAALAPTSGACAPSGCDRGSERPFVWRPMISPPEDAPALNGHTDTVPDIVGRIGSPIDLAIFTEGNHFPALLAGGAIDRFRAWAHARPQYSALRLDNIVVVTLPQPMVVAMLLTGTIAFGNLTLDVSRASRFFPDIVMGGAAPLRALRKASIVEHEARVFARNRGPALMLAAKNPLDVHRLADLTRDDLRIVLASDSEPAARSGYVAALDGLLGLQAAQATMGRETVSFPGRLGIQHRDVPYALARGFADVGIIVHHLAQYYAGSYADLFAMVAVAGAEQFASTIAMTAAVDPLRPLAAKAFAEFFIATARDLYPRHGFAPMADAEYGAAIALE
jgi:hypothetical protein